ncbi:MAG: hypothetical protein P8L77_05810 [Gammaproteobacteria bacterium]|nr:hypothetical protein [Gammaproteobacteria bacterium]
MNNLIKIMCVSVMLSGTALALGERIDGKTGIDRSITPITIVKVGDNRFDLDQLIKDDKLIVQDKNGKKAVFKLDKALKKIDSQRGVGTDRKR